MRLISPSRFDFFSLFLSSTVVKCAYSFFFFLMIRRPPRSTLFPYRRSSDLIVIKDLKVKGSSSVVKGGTKVRNIRLQEASDGHNIACKIDGIGQLNLKSEFVRKDRKSTRLNSSHQIISYAVFCL